MNDEPFVSIVLESGDDGYGYDWDQGRVDWSDWDGGIMKIRRRRSERLLPPSCSGSPPANSSQKEAKLRIKNVVF